MSLDSKDWEYFHRKDEYVCRTLHRESGRYTDMARLIPEKLHVKYLSRAAADAPIAPRFYALTHSDFTGDLFLSIGSDYDKKQISGLYTRMMRDEVLAELRKDPEGSH